MSTVAAVVVAGTVIVFVIFALVLAWADYRTTR